MNQGIFKIRMMQKRSMLILSALAFNSANAQVGAQKPNIIYIMADDAGYAEY